MSTPTPTPTPDATRLAGHLLVDCLIAQGVTTCFGVPGESYLAVLDGFFERQGQIDFVSCRQESGAAFMAEASGKMSGRPGVCFVTRGPGASNAAVGLHTAFQDSTPLVLFIGQVAADQRDREAFQEVDYGHMFGPGTLGMAKWVGEVHDPDRLPEYVSRAFHTAMQGRPGPVVVVLPETMLTTLTAAPPLPRAEPAHAWPQPSAIDGVGAMLRAAQRPLVIAGGSGWTPEATRSLQDFSEEWCLPVACAFRFQDLFDNRHENYAGDVGIGINPRLAARIGEADLIVAIGPRLGEMTTGGYTLLEAPRPRQRLIHIHAGADELGKVYAADLLVQASMAAAAPSLSALPAPTSVPWVDWTEDAHDDYQANLIAQPMAPLDMAAVVNTMQYLAPPDTMWVNGAGNFSGWLHRYCRYSPLHHFGRSQLAPTSGAMGYGVPAAIAASLQFPDRLVVNVSGDGDFLMTGQELATASAYGATRLVMVVVDNGVYGTIRMHQQRAYPQRHSATDLFNPDFAALAKAYGWRAARVETTEAFTPIFADAATAGRPTLIHLKLDPRIVTTRTTMDDLVNR